MVSLIEKHMANLTANIMHSFFRNLLSCDTWMHVTLLRL
jgi:hypothetical protein